MESRFREFIGVGPLVLVARDGILFLLVVLQIDGSSIAFVKLRSTGGATKPSFALKTMDG